MQTYNDIDHQHGDLALLHEALEVCLDEITQLLALQQNVNQQRVRYQVSSAIDIRLKAIAIMNNILRDCSANILPKFRFDETVLLGPTSVEQLNCLSKFIADSAQNIELIKNIKRYIQSSKIKLEFANVVNALVQSHQQLQIETEQLVANEQE